MKRKITFLLSALIALILLTQPEMVLGQTRGTYDKTEGFELATVGNDYQNTVTVSADDSDCGISWEIYYGCVSTSSAISGNSAALRLYATNNYGYLKTTTPVYGLSNVACKAKAAETNGAKIKINIDYSVNGSDWVSIEANKELSSSVDDYDWDIPSDGKYFRISISSSSTKPSKKNAQLTIDDIKFTYTGYTVTYDANSGTGTMTDDDSPYGSGATVTVLDNEFTAPASCEFVCWNTQDDGNGTDYYPDDNEHNTFAISTNTTLYAIWNQVSADPSMTVSETALSGFTSVQSSNLPSASQSFKVSGANLNNNNITIALDANSDFEISTDNSTFGSSVEPLVPSSGTVAQTTFYVRMKASATSGAKTGSITISCDAIAESSSISLSGTVIPVHTLTYSATNGSIAGVYSGTSTTVASGASVAEGATVSLTAAPSDGYRFTGWSDGGDNSTLSSTTTNPTTFTMGSADKTITATFELDPVRKTSLVSSDMAGMTNAGSGYGALKYTTTLDGFYWETNGYQNDGSNNQTALYNAIQLRKRDHNSGLSYIKLPEFNGKIENIVLSVTDAANGSTTYSNGGNCKATVYFQSGTTTSENAVVSGGNTSTGTKEITLDLSGKFYSTGYITLASGASGARFWNIEVNYQPYQNMSGTILSSIANDATISIPANTNATATDLYIPASSGVIIKSGAKLTVSGTLTNNGTAANLVIEDGGQLIVNNSGVKATVKKALPEATSSKDENWTTIASPVKNISIGDTDEDGNVTHLKDVAYALYRLNETTSEWENYKNGAYHDGEDGDDFEILEAGRGYLYSRTSLTTLEYVGEVNGDEYTEYTLTMSGNKISGFHLIGNPYSHDIYKGAAGNGYAIPNTAETGYDNPYELATGFYQLKNGTSWLPKLDDGNKIEKGEGILVQATTAGTLRIYNSATAPAKANTINHDNIMFTVVNGQHEDVAYAMFDKGIGLSKINHRDNVTPMIYIEQKGEDYAIATMSDDTKSFNLNFKAMTTGQYTLSYKANGDFNYLHIIDRLTGEDVDMLIEGEYKFIGTPSDKDNRFIVRLGYMPDYSDADNDIFAYQSGSDILVSGAGELQIFDVTGRKVMTTMINGAESINLSAKGIYVFRLVGETIKTQKIVVR